MENEPETEDGPTRLVEWVVLAEATQLEEPVFVTVGAESGTSNRATTPPIATATSTAPTTTSPGRTVW